MSTKKPTEEQLNSCSKETLISLYLQLLKNFETLRRQNEQLIKQTARLEEDMAVLVQQRFGHKTEKTASIPGQLVLDPDKMCILNEAEVITENLFVPEPYEDEVIPARKRTKQKGKREEDLKDIPTVVIEHTIPEDRLSELFPAGYHRLPDEIYHELAFIPSSFEDHEHHIAVYAGKKSDSVVKADKPERLLSNSLLTPSFAAAIINAKYVNAVPINRISEEFKRNGVNVSRQVMANWMIRMGERYLSLIYDAMHEELLKNRLIHCDETPFVVTEDRETRGPNAKSYMWVYHATGKYGTPPIFLYEYQPTRKTDHPREFLRNYKGILMTDGYQVYHTLEKERPDELKVAGCWAHAKRHFAEVTKAVGTKTANGMIADEANKRIAAIYHVDNMCRDKSDPEKLSNRQKSVKPLVDAFFVWVKTVHPEIDQSSKTGRALGYCLHQELYLRAFLENPVIPLDNNDAERSIRTFCVGKHNWHIADSSNGAAASGVIYSITQTAIANGLNVFHYLSYLFEEMPKHMKEKSTAFVKDLLPWSDQLPEICQNPKKQ
jgi:transposase